MYLHTIDPIAQNIQGVSQLVGSGTNKINSNLLKYGEGVTGEKVDVLTLKLDDEELLQLAEQIENDWGKKEPGIKLRQEAFRTYYLGKQKGNSSEAQNGMTVSDNIIFEATETFVPASLTRNPEPVVFGDDSEQGNALADKTKAMLQYHATMMDMRAMLNLTVRKWLIDLLGVIKHGWDAEIKDIEDDVRDAKNFIFDKNGYVDLHGHYVGTLGEMIKSTASELIDEFPDSREYVTAMVDGKMGTEVTRTEWWNDKYTFTTFKKKVLDKSKNPHFNYSSKSTDEEGNETEEPGNNFFARPIKPYTFLTVFTFGDTAHDVTGLIEQNISNQRRITRRTEQIDFNLSRQNNSEVFSADNFNQETAKQAKNARVMGNAIIIPKGRPIKEAIDTLEAKGLDSAFFDDMENQKTALRMSFGTEGITASPPDKNELATGIIANEQHDGSRITGGVGDALERVAKSVFQYHVQMYHVYYTVKHEARILGQMQAVEYHTLSQDDFTGKLVVTVAPDSMKPRDEVSEMNEAITLYQEKALDPKTLLTRIHFPDPQKTAEQTVLWLIDPMSYLALNFPEVAQQVQQNQQAQMQQQQQAQQQQMQMEAQSGQQQVAQKQQAGEQQINQNEQSHQQKMRHNEDSHKQKLEQQKQTLKAKPKEKTKIKEKK